MTTAITVYDGIQDPLAFVKEAGKAIALSNMFGCQSEHQGIVLAMECVAKRLPPLSLAERYHIIQGKLSMKADAILAAFRGIGGEHKLIQRDSDAAEIELQLKKEKHRFKLTWAEAQQERFPYGSGGKLKDNWATPRGRMQMMWARVVSDGVRAMAPEVVAGYYAPEELQDSEAIDVAPARTQPQPDVETLMRQAAQQPPVIEVVSKPGEEVTIKTESAAVPSADIAGSVTAVSPPAPRTTQPATAAPPQSAPFDASQEHTLETVSPMGLQMLASQIKQCGELGMTQQQIVEVRDRFTGGGGRTLKDLTPNAATEMSKELAKFIQERKAGAGGNGFPAESGRVPQSEPPAPAANGHITRIQIDQINATLDSLEASGDETSRAAVAAMLKGANKQLHEISSTDAAGILERLFIRAGDIERRKSKAKN